ncbi:MAG: hypothetical protein OEO20_13740, partial [Gemmatimonadota bacterium]|nr:hypothetical protein [Gemmatimonadota bacterium]
PTDCVRCHSLDTWVGGAFDHITASAGFNLVGAHATAPCASCHVIPGYAPLFTTTDQNDCVACHQSDHDAQHGAGFPTDCVSCHSLDTWVGGAFDHITASAGFNLVGAHALAPCASCHVIPGYAPLFTTTDQNDCVACHQSDHDAQHGAGFPTDCVRCHTLDTWVGGAFDHITASAGFNLVGAHATAPCASCHVIPGYAPLFTTTDQNDCVGCHQSDHDAQHGAGFPTDCVSCHTVETWVGATFNHRTASGGFQLLGAHATAPCASCHVIPGYAPRFTTTDQNDCVTCHQSDHDAQHGVGFPTDCVSCHTVDTWTGGTFDHVSASTGFALVGAHATAPCASCHVIPGYAPLFTTTNQNDCIGCHQSDHDTQHGAGFPTDCVSCHTLDTWVGATFDHITASAGFALVGAHATAPCASCHVIPGYAPRFTTTNQNDCIGCHQSDHDAQHGAGFPTDCVSCHTLDTWVGATFDHITASAGFALVGAHATAPCASCHVIPGYAPRFTTTNQNDCIGCHQSDHDAQHGSGFPTDCVSCHNLNTWLGATFDHATASAGFNLVGAHATAPCASCHVIPGYAPRFAPTSQNDCIACHQSDHDAQHGSGFPTDCVSCHNLNTWLGATFNHTTASGGFQLLGAHDVAPCASCHVIPGYAPRFATTNHNDCIGCHQSDYDTHHAGTGFSTDCLTCHTINTWGGATFNHDALYFPIYSGRHAGRWSNDCTICHEVPDNFQQFTCFNCHKHNKSSMDDEHRGENGYVYESTACLRCHPDGRG